MPGDRGTICHSCRIGFKGRRRCALRTATSCDKLNVGALGNVVAQLHIHIVARFAGDAAWPKPVWGFGVAVPYGDTDRERLTRALGPLLRPAQPQ